MGNSPLVPQNLNCCIAQPGYRKLESQNLSAEVRRQNLIIFDWDDTLMCSSEIKSQRKPDEKEIRSLEAAVARVLETSMRLGKTTIVTNANLCWVHATASMFMPALLPLLELIDVFSARQCYEELYPDNPCAWKIHAFRDLVSGGSQNVASAFTSCWDGTSESSQENCSLNLIVLGDSTAEIQAGRSAVRDHQDPDTILKTVKFKALPTVTELAGQLEAVANSLERVVSEEKHMCQHLVRKSGHGWSLCETSDFQQVSSFAWEG